MSQWTLFSNHGHVLVVLSRDPDARLRDVAQVVGITERAVQKIVRDLQDGGMISVEKQGRRNRYRLHGDVPLRHALEAHCSSGALLSLINDGFDGIALVDQVDEPVVKPAVAPAGSPAPAQQARPEPETEPEMEPEAAPESKPEPEPEPEPKRESEPESTPKKEPVTKPASDSQPGPASSTPATKRPRKKAPEDDPMDQGSLF